MRTTGILTFVVGWIGAIVMNGYGLTVAENGEARVNIVVAADAPAPVQFAATELSKFLGEVTGGTFPINNTIDPLVPAILVGSGAATLVDPAFSIEDLGSEGIILRTAGEHLILAGGEPRGTLYAVYTFLEDQAGCRWWSPTVSTIPHRPNLQVNALDKRHIPVFEERDTDAASARDGDWSARNKYNGQSHNLRNHHGGNITRVPGFVHTFFGLINPEVYFAEHPEWFSELNGQRNHVSPNYEQSSLCLSNEAMRLQLVENLKEALRDGPILSHCTGLSEVRFHLADGSGFVGQSSGANRWDTSGSIKVSASSQHKKRVAVRAVNGTGLDEETGTLHSSDPEHTLFITGLRKASAASPLHHGAVPGEHWVAFEFDQAYPLGELWIWNYNELGYQQQGVRNATIRYSATGGADPAEWTTIYEGEVPEAPGSMNQPHQLAVDFAGVSAKYVVITMHRNWAEAGSSNIAEVSQPDDGGPPDRCECDACRAIEKEEGGPSGLLVRFANAVAADLQDEFPGVPVSTLAYHYTQPPATKTKPSKDVIIRLCDIHASFSVPLSDDRNHKFRDDLLGWSKVCQRLYIWDYVANFTYYINPHPNLRVLAPNVRFLVDHGAKGYFAEAIAHSPGMEFAELRSWVLAKLMWNPDLDGDALVEEFVNGYYGPGGKDVMAYINLMHDAVEESGDYLGLSSPPDANFLTLKNLTEGWKHLAAAEKAAGDDVALQRRIRIAQLPVKYVFLSRFSELREQAIRSNTPWPMPVTIEELHADIKAIAQQEGIMLAGMSSPIAF